MENKMRTQPKILIKLTILLSLLIIPYYIHIARIERILKKYKYTQRSNSTVAPFNQQKIDIHSAASIDNQPFQELIPKIYNKPIFLFNVALEEFIILNQTKKFFLNSDLPPPNFS
ncbi:MAG: hypothetical protein KA146_06755 [Leptospiraceae bacterium]|jgi:hypothetical protein|nr:hypothetical protein [Leptospiraceae bacterium]